MYTVDKHDNKIIYKDNVEKITIEISEKNFAGFTVNSDISAIDDKKLRNSICSPVSGKRLRDIAADNKAVSACVIVSDATRKMPTDKAAEVIVKELQDAGIALSEILFVVALGVHRDATEEEMRELIGDELYSKVRIENHTPYDKDNLIRLGNTGYGTPVIVNKGAYECDIHVSIGKVEPHEFAGFSGGRKSVLPGISSEETIILNHSVEMISSEKSVPGCMDGNPVSNDMIEAAELFHLDYCVNFILNPDDQTAAVFSGSMIDSHESAIDYIRTYCKTSFKKPDIIVTTPGNPLNIDFYQSLKSIIALTDVLDSSVTIALYCECREGINSPDMMKPFENSNNLDEVNDYLSRNYRIQMDHSLLLSKILRKNVKIVLFSPNISSSEIETLHMISCESIEEMMKKSMQICGKENPKIMFYPQPQRGLPVLL